MVDKSKLTDSLVKLEVELRNSGKIDTADFFEKFVITITSETDAKKLKQLLEQICSSGAMSQYANFSFAEDELFDDCFEEAKKLLSMI